MCKNLVNIGRVTSEFEKGVCGIFAATRSQMDDRLSFGAHYSTGYLHAEVVVIPPRTTSGKMCRFALRQHPVARMSLYLNIFAEVLVSRTRSI